jgi:UDP-galactopyranose mutase
LLPFFRSEVTTVREFKKVDLVCLSHLRWHFVFQRPQHLMVRFARERRVFFVEEPVAAETPGLEVTLDASGVWVVTPQVPAGLSPEAETATHKALLDAFFARHRITSYVLWYYTPMMLRWSQHLTPLAVLYDCMDDLSAFAGAPAGLVEEERRLLERADVVTTGGHSLYEAKRGLHVNVHAIPSSVDVAHFARARTLTSGPADQAGIARPRLGFFGVIDERMDLKLIAGLAAARPSWQIVLVGPIVKIDPATVPVAPNVHLLGAKRYEDLPGYIAGWDVALLPFARNRATRFISPTKTPEYLAAGKPVVSTSITDVVRPYGERGLVRIADDLSAFVEAVEATLGESASARQTAADAFLKRMSWDATWRRMRDLLDGAVASRGVVRGDDVAAVAA